MTTQNWDFPPEVQERLNRSAEMLEANAPKSMPELPHKEHSVNQEPEHLPESDTQKAIPKAHGNRPVPKVSPALAKHIEKQLNKNDIKPLPPTVEVEPVHSSGPIYQHYTPTGIADKVSVALPSRFAFYPFKDLYVGKLQLSHFGKLHEAHVTRSLSALCEVISSLLYTTDPDYQGRPLAFELTLPDFFWLLYYVRTNQIKVTLEHTYTCSNPDHVAKVQEGILTPASLQNTTRVDTSTLQVRMLKSAPDMSVYSPPEGVLFRPALMRDAIECADHPLYQQSPASRYTFRLATLITLLDNPDASIEDRLEYLESVDYATLSNLANFRDHVDIYGVDEYIITNCGECGHQERVKISIDAHSFLPI